MDRASMPSWSRAPSTHNRFPLRSSLSQYILSFIEVSLGVQYVLSRQPVVTDLSLSALPSLPREQEVLTSDCFVQHFVNPPSILAPFPTTWNL